MTNFILELSIGLKNLFREKINLVIFLLLLNVTLSTVYYLKITNNINQSTTTIRKKVDHRYFNTTRTIEQIYDVRIDTFSGDLKLKVKP